MVAAQAAVERKDMAVVTSTRNFLRSLGGTVSLAAAAAVINNALQSRLRPIGFSGETITTIINDPLILWRDAGQLQALLGTATRGQVVDAYVAGFRKVFLIFVGLQGFNWSVAGLYHAHLFLCWLEHELIFMLLQLARAGFH